MIAYGIIILLVGIGLLGAVIGIITWLQRRWHQPYALLTVGIITAIVSLLIQMVLLRVLDRALLGILPLSALAAGLLAGFVQETARLLGYQYLAPSVVTRPQALMIGTGHSLPWALYTSLLVAGVGLSLLGGGENGPGTLTEVTGDALGGALNGLLPFAMHMALSWTVLQVFLRGQIYWLFIAIFGHTSVEIMAGLLGTGESWLVVGWRTLVALVSLRVIVALSPPPPETWQPDTDLRYNDMRRKSIRNGETLDEEP
jgi:uncharacterized membrane protein YhfC